MNALEPDRSEIETFVNALFKHAGTVGFVSCRSFPDDGSKSFSFKSAFLEGGLKHIVDIAVHEAANAANATSRVVFCPPVATFKGTRQAGSWRARAKDVLRGLALSVECDAQAQVACARLEKMLGPATLVVASGGQWTDPATGEKQSKLHLHWRLKTPAEGKAQLLNLKCARDLATRLVGGDPTNKAICHPIRWPGSWHRKGEPVLCRVEIANPDREIDLDAALTALTAASSNGHDKPQSRGASDDPHDVPPVTEEELRADIYSGRTYHGPLVQLAARSVGRGWSAERTIKLLQDLMDGSAGPRDARWRMRYDEIPRIVETAVAKYSTAAEPHEDDSSAVLIRASDVVMRAKDWLWEGHLLRGAQELMTGIPGLGKSQIQCSFVGCATTKRRWPDGTPGLLVPVSVLMITAEDCLDQEVVPRLIAAGADLNKVHFLKCIKKDNKQRQFLLNEDLDQLETCLARVKDVGLIAIDPITAYMGGKVDSHKTTEVRSQLGPLKDFAERSNVAVSTVTHPPKSSSQRAIDHFIGSQAFIAAGRIGHVVVEEKDEDGEPTGRVLFTNAKNNAGPKMPTLAYKQESITVGQDQQKCKSIVAPYIVWDDKSVNISADAAVAAASGRGQKDKAKGEVCDFLRGILNSGDPVPYKQIEDEARHRHGFTEKQLRTAKEKLGIKSEKDGLQGGWMWKLEF